MSTTLQQIAQGQSYPEVPINANFQTVGFIGMFGHNASTTGLVWSYFGGRYNGTLIAPGSVTLTNAATNHIVAHRTTGAVTTAVATTAWNDTATYARLYLVVTAGGVVTGTPEDWRFGASGLISPPGAVAASAVGIDDAGGYYAGTTVEAALQEAGAGADALALAAAALAEAQVSVWVAGKPDAGEVLLRFKARVPFTLPASGTGSSSSADVEAAAQADFLVQKNGATVCTVRFAAAGAAATFIAASPASWAVGDVFKLIGPATQDATLSDIDVSLLVTRS